MNKGEGQQKFEKGIPKDARKQRNASKIYLILTYQQRQPRRYWAMVSS